MCGCVTSYPLHNFRTRGVVRVAGVARQHWYDLTRNAAGMSRLLALIALAALTLSAFPYEASANSYKPSSAGVTLEVVMNEDGRVNVKGARVREVLDSGFTAETLWGAGKLMWTVETGENTPILRKDGGRIALAEVTAGDYVSFTGTIQTTMAPFTIDATTVRDWSVSKNNVVHSGTVSEIDTEARTLTLLTGDGELITIKTSEDTAFAQSGARTFSDIAEGDSVIVVGAGAGKGLVAQKVNLTERAVASAASRPKIATGFGAWVDNFLPKFFVGRMN